MTPLSRIQGINRGWSHTSLTKYMLTILNPDEAFLAPSVKIISVQIYQQQLSDSKMTDLQQHTAVPHSDVFT